MAARRGIPLTYGFIGFIFLVLLFVHKWEKAQKMRAEKMQQMQEIRRRLLRELCEGDEEAFSDGKHSLDDLRLKELDNFIVDDTRGIIYCYIPKVACTNWKRVMFALNKNKLDLNLLTLSQDFIHHTQELTLLSSFPRAEIRARLKHYTKFLFVRDPFVRLISAYRDKFLDYNEFYYENFARSILTLYGNNPDPPKKAEEAFASGVRPSFYNFIQYVLETKYLDPHWKPMHSLCHPCLIQYDFVGHQETLREDAEHLLKILQLENDIRFPASYRNVTTTNSLFDWYKTVPLEDRRKLYKLYEEDFQLFGYRKPSELLEG